MRFAIVSYQIPDVEGTAAGRLLAATVDGLQQLGHEVRVWSWRRQPPEQDLPEWCHWSPVPSASAARVRARALVMPRSEVVRGRWPFPDPSWRAEAVAVADEPSSFPAVAEHPRNVVTVHYSTALDEGALGRTLPGVQDRRAERRAARQARVVVAYSPRVADALGGRAVAVPAAYPVPVATRPAVEAPVAAVAADWRWPPNRWALSRLLAAWPEVRDRVSGARLRLAGAGLDAVGTVAGVEVLGPIASSTALLADAAVLPFPCPATSGPKVKVLEAMSLGVPVVCTPAGLEGIAAPDRAVALVDPAAPPAAVAARIIEVLSDPAVAAALGSAGRAAVEAAHAPVPAVAARLRALDAAMPVA